MESDLIMSYVPSTQLSNYEICTMALATVPLNTQSSTRGSCVPSQLVTYQHGWPF